LDPSREREGKMAKTELESKSLDHAARERLLTAATELFSRKGYSATTTREIVTTAGVTKPVLYYYFRNKEGIYLELMRGAFAKLDTLLNTYPGARGTATERLLRLSDRIFSLFMENIEVSRLMYSIYYGPPQGAPFFDFDNFHFKFHDKIRQLLNDGIRGGELIRKNLTEMTWAVIGAINIAMEIQLCHPEKGLGKEGLNRILTLIFRGISTTEGKRKGERK
jgi:TetR/AcrR family transcriptional regulator